MVGDTVLKALAKMLRMHMAASMVARIGGAEFIIFFGDMKAEEVFCPIPNHKLIRHDSLALHGAKKPWTDVFRGGTR
ncbi:hypothetical protein BFS10_00485 [Brucella suis]|nr:hypothetical protein BFS10_00485 [Brucella suis]